MAPERTLGVVLTHGLAVTGGVDVSDLSYHVIVTQGPLSHIAGGQGRLHGGRGPHSGCGHGGRPHSGAGNRGGTHSGGGDGGGPLSGSSRGLTVGDGRRRWTAHTARARLCGVAGGEEEALGRDVGEEVTLCVVPVPVNRKFHSEKYSLDLQEF